MPFKAFLNEANIVQHCATLLIQQCCTMLDENFKQVETQANIFQNGVQMRPMLHRTILDDVGPICCPRLNKSC